MFYDCDFGMITVRRFLQLPSSCSLHVESFVRKEPLVQRDEVVEAHPFRSDFDAVRLGGLCHPFSPLSSFPHGLGVKSLSPTDFPVSPVVKTVSPVDFSLGATD